MSFPGRDAADPAARQARRGRLTDELPGGVLREDIDLGVLWSGGRQVEHGARIW